MPKTAKFRAKHVFWDSKNKIVRSKHDIEIWRCNGKLKLPDHIWRFDSQHEFKVYLELVRIFGANRVKRQHSVELIPPGICYPKGKSWRIDFAITSIDDSELYDYLVEAKGAFLPEFATTLAMFESINICAFDTLFIVFPDRLPKKSRVVNSLLKTNFRDHLITLKELKKSKNLP